MSKEIVVLASGNGSNFQSIIDGIIRGTIKAKIRCLVTDRLCSAIDRADKHGIDFCVVNRKNSKKFNVRLLTEILNHADLVVCAGYLSIIPPSIVSQMKGKIINIHPSLLPDFGGMGMHGMNVHKAVIASGKNESGCTIHYVDAGIDTGEIIRQSFVDVKDSDTPEDLQKKVMEQEQKLLPDVVRQLIE